VALAAVVPDVAIRRIVGIMVIAIGARYLWAGLGRSPAKTASSRE
jgi:uncharacterized membrane protein YfcA